ncbi:unnamed protein product [Linum tenue]|uniref:Protein groES n=1 Tax=Linum tenue TaxID=586396 RepID=A0AAV0QAG5_9ROSI|nr:unnamed protein product [Linum tenue]
MDQRQEEWQDTLEEELGDAKELGDHGVDLRDPFWEKLKLAAEKKVGAAEAKRFCKAFQQVHRKLVYEELSLDAAQRRKLANIKAQGPIPSLPASHTSSLVQVSFLKMAKRLIPALNRILVEKIVAPSKTAGGILLPEKTSKLNSGKVVAVGPGLRDKNGNHIPVAVKEGDTVLLPDYGGMEVKLADKEYHLYRDEDILGTLHE